MAKPASGSTLNTGHALATSLVACWPLLEGTGGTSADLSAGGRTLTLTTPTWTTEGGDACIVNATSATTNAVALSSQLSLAGNQDWSIAWKGRQIPASANGILLGLSSSSNSFVLNRSDGANLYCRFRDATNSATADITYSGFATLHNYVLTYTHSTTTLELYADGVSVGTASYTTGADININRLMSYGGGSLGYVGNIHYLYIWDNRALNSTEAGDLNTDPYDMLDPPAPSDAVTIAVGARILQRNPTSASLSISGTYSGATADAVQAKLFLDADDSTVVDWADVDASLSGDVWSGSITVPAGGPYYLQARLHDSGNSTLATSGDSNLVICGDVFGSLGQSNADGRTTGNQLYTGSSAAWVVRQSGTIDTTLNDPISDTGTNGSFWPYLATLISAHVGSSIPICVVNQTAGGTGLYNDEWQPTGGSQWLLADALIDGLSLNAMKAVLWLQGESDIFANVTESQYETAEGTLATSVAGWPGAPPLVSTLTGHQTAESDADIDAIRKAKIDNWNNAVTKYGANPIDIDLSDAGGDGIHYKTAAEVAELAGRMWLALQDAVYSGTNGRGPRASSAGFEDDTVRVVFDQTTDSGDTTYTSSAWSVTSNGSPATISSVTRVGTNAVDIVCNAALNAPVTVTFGSGNTPAGATVPKTEAKSLPATINSISSVKLPAEPFFAMAAGAGFPGGGSAANLLLMGVG